MMDISKAFKLSELIKISDDEYSDSSCSDTDIDILDNFDEEQNFISTKLTDNIKSEVVENNYPNNIIKTEYIDSDSDSVFQYDNELSEIIPFNLNEIEANENIGTGFYPKNKFKISRQRTIDLNAIKANENIGTGVYPNNKYKISRRRINKLKDNNSMEKAFKITTKTNVMQNKSRLKKKKKSNNSKIIDFDIKDFKVDITNIPPVYSTLVNAEDSNTSSSNDPIYECCYCGKTCKYKSNLIYHIRSHYTQRPFKCKICKRSFVNSTDLKVHHRIHTGEKPYKCTICNKYFARTQFLSRHIRVHTGEKPYHCDMCVKKFRVSYQLTVHKRTHTGHRPYKCGECEKSFTSSSILKNHSRSHTGEKPYKCNKCEKTYTRQENVRKHKNKFHPE